MIKSSMRLFPYNAERYKIAYVSSPETILGNGYLPRTDVFITM